MAISFSNSRFWSNNALISGLCDSRDKGDLNFGLLTDADNGKEDFLFNGLCVEELRAVLVVKGEFNFDCALLIIDAIERRFALSSDFGVSSEFCLDSCIDNFSKFFLIQYIVIS